MFTILAHNDKVLKQKSTIQQKKFNKLLNDKKLQHDPEKIIFNYPSYVLSEAEKCLFQKGLNFIIPPESILSILSYFAEIFVTLRFFLQKSRFYEVKH